jgi:hypothetical protein
MQLSHYLRDHKLSMREFAGKVGVANASVVCKWASGQQVPRSKYMTAIVRETGGQVQPNDFFAPAEV